MKKMTQKEFKQIFNESGFDFDIWGYEGVLNLICMAMAHEAELNEEHGFPRLAEHSRERKNKIFDALQERGYFDT